MQTISRRGVFAGIVGGFASLNTSALSGLSQTEHEAIVARWTEKHGVEIARRMEKAISKGCVKCGECSVIDNTSVSIKIGTSDPTEDYAICDDCSRTLPQEESVR